MPKRNNSRNLSPELVYAIQTNVAMIRNIKQLARPHRCELMKNFFRGCIAATIRANKNIVFAASRSQILRMASV